MANLKKATVDEFHARTERWETLRLGKIQTPRLASSRDRGGEDPTPLEATKRKRGGKNHKWKGTHTYRETSRLIGAAALTTKEKI